MRQDAPVEADASLRDATPILFLACLLVLIEEFVPTDNGSASLSELRSMGIDQVLL